jgi:hypothetical protein
MKMKFSFGAASVGALAAYGAAVRFKLPLMTYEPVEGAWQAGRGTGGLGMMWYGFVAAAALAGAVAGLVIPEPRSSRAWNAAQWLLPLALLILIAAHDSSWFTPPR